MRRFRNQGFTLMELLLVIFIIGILATAAISTFGPQVRQAGWLGESRSNISRIRSVINTYHDQKGEYPKGWDDLKTEGLFEKPEVKSSTYDLTGGKGTYTITVTKKTAPNANSTITVNEKAEEKISWVEQ